MRALGRQAEHDAPSGQAQALAHIAVGVGSTRRIAPRPSGTTSMRSAGSTDELDEVVARALRIGDHAMRRGARRTARARASPCRERRHAPRESARRSGRARSRRGESAPTAAPCSRGCARGRRSRGGERGSSVCSPSTHCTRRRALHRHGHDRQQLAQLATVRPPVAGLAVDERREAHARGRRLRAAPGSARARRPPCRPSRPGRGRSGSGRCGCRARARWRHASAIAPALPPRAARGV